MKKSSTYSAICFLLCCAISPVAMGQQKQYTDVLVVGGGAGGTAAGLQSASMGSKTIIAESTTWLGGMLTSAGVSAIDGNHNLPSGIWGAFRNKLYQVYGGPKKVETGWVSNTLFEPHVGDSILKAMVAQKPLLQVFYKHHFLQAIKRNKNIQGAVFLNVATGKEVFIYAKQVIDATELGDVMASAGVPYDVGMEASSITGENVGVPAYNNIVQDITYAAILKDFGPKADCTIVKPAGYTPEEFDGACTDYYLDKTRKAPVVDAQKMLDYGKLPNNKYMLNWPNYGNDIYLNVINLDTEERVQELEKAKEQTKRFIYFIQTQLGFKQLGLANDEFPTIDRFPQIPYHREGRRVRGLVRFKLQHILQPFEQDTPLYRTGISVGDYPIDHHHKKNEDAPQHLDFPPVPSFNIPLGALIPKYYTGLITAEKGISVSNVVNGTTRLQPCVLLTGQAAGALAALAAQQKTSAKKISVRAVQEVLLNAGAYIMPYYDVGAASPYFLSIQKIGATGLLKGTGEPNAWANRTWFFPDSLVSNEAVLPELKHFDVKHADFKQHGYMTINSAIDLCFAIMQKNKIFHKNAGRYVPSVASLQQLVQKEWTAWELANFSLQRNITRAEFSVLADKTIQPFNLKQVRHNGFFK